MQALYWFEALRRPALDWFFSLVTMLGEETVFLVLGILIFWCVSKQKGYYILIVGFLGLVINQFLKITCRVPRPWVKDPNFTIVEKARAAATGYSFPSGHTQISVGVYGSIARAWKKSVLRLLCTVLCILVPMSRLYLGVHTLADVITSVIIALFLIIFIYPLISYCFDTTYKMHFLFGGLSVLAAAYLLYLHVFTFPADIDKGNYADALLNAYKIFGSLLGVWLGYAIDSRYVRFEPKAPMKIQIAKVVLGLCIVLFMKSALKSPLVWLCGDSGMAGSIRYFLITLFVCGIWPWVFSHIQGGSLWNATKTK